MLFLYKSWGQTNRFDWKWNTLSKTFCKLLTWQYSIDYNAEHRMRYMYHSFCFTASVTNNIFQKLIYDVGVANHTWHITLLLDVSDVRKYFQNCLSHFFLNLLTIGAAISALLGLMYDNILMYCTFISQGTHPPMARCRINQCVERDVTWKWHEKHNRKFCLQNLMITS